MKTQNIEMTEGGDQIVNLGPQEGIIVASTGVSQASMSFVDIINPEKKLTDQDLEAAKKAAFLGEGPLGKTIWSLTWPDFIGKMVQALYVLVDAVYIGNMAGNNQQEKSLSLASCTLAMPVDQLFHISIGLLIGVGTNALYGQNLGKGDLKKARRIIGNMYFMCILIGILYPAIIYWFITPLLQIAGASDADGTLELARQYLKPLVFGMILTCLAMCHNNAIRGEGNSKFSALCMLLGGILNIIMDPILIRLTGNSIRGAAYATMCGNLLSSIMGIWYFTSKHGAVVLHWSDLIPDIKIIGEVVNVGVSGFISSASGSIVTVIMNNLLLKYSSINFNTLQVTEILAVVGSCGKMSFFCFMPMMSLSHGCLPIYSYCYGAKKFERFNNTTRIHFFAEMIMGCILTILGSFVGQYTAVMFSSSLFFKQVFNEALRYVTSGLIFNAVTMSVFPCLQACGRGLPSAIILFLKQLLFLLLFANVFCALLQDWWGNMYSYPLAEVAGALLSVCAYLIYKDVFRGLKE